MSRTAHRTLSAAITQKPQRLPFAKSRLYRLGLLLPALLLLLLAATSAGAQEQAWQPFDRGYELDEQARASYSEADSLPALLEASPFYAGRLGPGARLESFNALRLEKIIGLTVEAVELNLLLSELDPQLEALEAAYAQYIAVKLEQDSSYSAYATFSLRELVRLQEERRQGRPLSILAATTTGDSFAQAHIDYLAVVNAITMGQNVLDRIDRVSLYAALPLEDARRVKQGAALAADEAALDKSMRRLDDMQADLVSVSMRVQQLSAGLRQVELADRQLALASLAYMSEEMPGARRAADALADRPDADPEMLKQVQGSLDFYQDWYAVLEQQLAEPAAGGLAAGFMLPAFDANQLGIMPASTVYGAQAVQTIGSAPPPPQIPASPGTWASINQAFGAAASSAAKTAGQVFDFNAARSTWGNYADRAGAYVFAISRITAGAYYGNTSAEVTQAIREEYQQIEKNYQQGRGGSYTYGNAKAYMEAAESYADNAAADFVKKTFGGTLTPWAAGKIAKGLTSVFTGLAKGVYILADPSSSKSQLAAGMLEIGFACAAGSSKAFEASSAGLAQLLKTSLGLASLKECMKVVAGEYGEDFTKTLVSEGLEGKGLVDAFLTHMGVDRKIFDVPQDDGNYKGSVTGQAQGEMYFSLQGSTWQGSIKGSFAWEIAELDMRGTSAFSCAIFGTKGDAGPQRLKGQLKGLFGKESEMTGSIEGVILRGKASGTWTATDGHDTLSGEWSAEHL
ncbi:hypothetical protein IT575_06195 [bacterium]|nr:hypothetical protein [bacterium]